MASHEKIISKLDVQIMEEASSVLKKMDMKIEDALNSFLLEIAMRGELPFEPSMPTASNSSEKIITQTDKVARDKLNKGIDNSHTVQRVAHEILKGPETKANAQKLQKLEQKNVQVRDERENLKEIERQKKEIAAQAIVSSKGLECKVDEEKRLVEDVLKARVEELTAVQKKLQDYTQMMTSDTRFQKDGKYWIQFQTCQELIAKAEELAQQIKEVPEDKWEESMTDLNMLLKDLLPVLEKVFPNPLN
jgi:antitoxin component of RelBE/YafQ-DinJ toxin-antitoxin module